MLLEIQKQKSAKSYKEKYGFERELALMRYSTQ